MAQPKTQPQAAERLYPTLEQFLETQDKEAALRTFAGTRAKLEEIKGPKAPQAKKALLALERTEALFTHLFQVREKLLEQAKKSTRTRR